MLLLYDKVLGQPLDKVEGVVRARKSTHRPVVLSRQEVGVLFEQLEGVPLLVCQLLYGSGLRVDEALSVRVKDLDFDRLEITVRQGKGKKDRMPMLPSSTVLPLRKHLRSVKTLHKHYLSLGLGRVPLPNALGRKYQNAELEWPWQWVFPAATHFTDRDNGDTYRYHLNSSVVQKAVRAGLSVRKFRNT